MTNKLAFLISMLIVSIAGISQKMITDGTVNYNVSVVNGKDQPGIAEAFDGATLTVAIKGPMIRSDLNSKVRLQSIFFNAQSGTAVILKESGTEKYMINLSAPQWEQYNRKYTGVKFDFTNDSKTIAGYNCKKASGTLKDGSAVTVYYAVDLKPVYQGYEYVFKDLPGLPLEYEITTGTITVKYLASSFVTTPVSASRFDLPKSGYKLLDYKQ
jgi:GLPGLI family protein